MTKTQQPPPPHPKWEAFRRNFTQSNYITDFWNWFMTLMSKAAEMVLFGTVLYSGYQLLPGVLPVPAAVDAAVFVIQQGALDIGGMGLLKLARRAKLPKDSFPVRLGVALVVLIILNVARWYNKQLDKIRSKRDRCKKGSRRYPHLSQIYKRVSQQKRNKQHDCLQKASHLIAHKLVERTVVVGDLSQRQMVMKEHRERNKHLNRAVFNDWGLYAFVQMLVYKCKLYGKEVVILWAIHFPPISAILGS